MRQAVHFANTTDDGFVMDRLAELSDVTPFLGLEVDAGVETVWTLCHRYGEQVLKGLSAVRAQFDDLRYRLEDGSLLQLMATRAHLNDAAQDGGVLKTAAVGTTAAVTEDLKQTLSPAPATGVTPPGAPAAAAPDFVRGKLRCGRGFHYVWVGDEHYDLRARKKAILCIQYLFENGAFDAASAKHLVDEIDPYVREQGGYAPPDWPKG